MNKKENIVIRCTEEYKKSLIEDACNTGMNVSEYIRFALICKLNLEKMYPDVYADLLEMTTYMDF